MSKDKRTVSTDALETLGMIIDESAGRDAIHLAVEPVTAAEALNPGDHIGIIDGRAGKSDKPLGIVDPFLKGTVQAGERFWLVVYPRQITSLRHVWSHPAFGDAPVLGPVAASRAWIEAFAADLDQTYGRLMDAASLWIECEEYTYDNSEAYKPHWDRFQEFWKHYEIVTNTKVDDHEATFFTCSC